MNVYVSICETTASFRSADVPWTKKKLAKNADRMADKNFNLQL